MADDPERVNELETQLSALQGTYDADKTKWQDDIAKKDAEIIRLQAYIANHLTTETKTGSGNKGDSFAERYAKAIKEMKQ